MPLEDALPHADIERQERERFGHGLADPQLLLRGGLRAGKQSEPRKASCRNN
jgi:hypothetical protein